MTSIAPEIFKAYDIRGIVDRTLTQAGVESIGRGLAELGRRKSVTKFVVGRDGRLPRDGQRNGLEIEDCRGAGGAHHLGEIAHQSVGINTP